MFSEIAVGTISRMMTRLHGSLEAAAPSRAARARGPTLLLALAWGAIGALHGADGAAAPAAPAAGGGPQAEALVHVAGLPPLQVLVGDVVVRELPVALTNLINVAYAPDGRLFAAGYDGRLHVLRAAHGDGLEDEVVTFVKETSDDFAIGMAYANQALYVLRRHALIRYSDSAGTGIPDGATTVAGGWNDPLVDQDPLYTHRRVDDALGLAVAPDGTAYVSMGAANYANPYLVDKQSGSAHLDLARRRGCVLRIAPGGRPEIFATGVRFLVGMHFNGAGDLFATDQEGATWIPNGNPFDELLQIQEGRHYGFPPRHPLHLPQVIDEPSVFDYAPQHQSTCGFCFNEGAQRFGPPSWAGDALITGESRGKLFRTKLVKTAAGYVARSQVVACLDTLPIDVALSPGGSLVMACHSGRPDWGSGPKGQGRLFKLTYADHGSPQVVAIGMVAANETEVCFDRPFSAPRWAALAGTLSLTMNRHAAEGDDCESFRPGYRAVDVQQQEGRWRVPIVAATLSADGRTARLRTAALVDDSRLVLSAHAVGDTAPPPGALPQLPLQEWGFDLGGVTASWTPSGGVPAWSGWLPHPDLAVARAFTAGSADHARLWALAGQPGTLRLSGQLDLGMMLRPAVQPGATLDYSWPDETVTVAFHAAGALALSSSEAGVAVRVDAHEGRLVIAAPRRWVPFSLTVAAPGGAAPDLAVWWSTNEDARPRALPLRRIRLPWAVPLGSAGQTKRIPEIAGGDWAAGKALFFSGFPGCARCHAIRGDGGSIAPDLSNLVERDYASVLRDIEQPSATINPDYPLYAIELRGDRVVQGVIVSSGPEAIRVGDLTGAITAIPRADIVRIHALATSLMPEGLITGLSAVQRRDLMTFLLSRSPAASP
jgi:putative heme-binding domain-containing protein